jgi:lipid-binding SYLF domain-containing protein
MCAIERNGARRIVTVRSLPAATRAGNRAMSISRRSVMNIRNLVASSGLALLGLLASVPSPASSKAQIDARADRAVTDFIALNPRHKELLEKAEGVLVFGHVTKGGVGIAGEFGEGVLRVKGVDVHYYSVASASVGLTLGVAEHSEILLFMTPDSLERFRKSQKWSVGADASVALVKQGAGGEYDSATLNKPILGFVFHEKGLIGDLSLEGSKITRIKTGE